MFKSILTIAARSLKKNKFFTAINIIGLSAGLACCLLIGLYVQHELNYDNFQKNGDRIGRLIMEYSFGQEPVRGNFTSTKVAPTFQEKFPEIESTIRFAPATRVVKNGDKIFTENGFVFADSTFFNIFSFPLLKGDPLTALDAPDKVVLTKSMAKKYFGDTDPVGKVLLVDIDSKPYQVTGVTDDCPSNSQIRYDFIASFSSLRLGIHPNYFNANYTTFLMLKPGIDMKSMEKKIQAFMKTEVPPENGNYITFFLEPFNSIHLHSTYDGFEPNNSITYIYIIIAVALLILIIACFTYINLATARSLERAKEVGIRKTVGAMKKQIFWQFIAESTTLSIIALIIGIIIVAFALPGFNELSGKNLSVSSIFTPATLVVCLLFVFSISLLAGSYPALILSGFQPILVLKGKFRNTNSGVFLRKSLVVFQFSITIFLIAATLIISHQLKFIQDKKLGYKLDQVLVLPMDNKMVGNAQAIKTELKSVAGVRSVSATVSTPVQIGGGYSMRLPEMGENQNIAVTANPVDEDFIKTSDLTIIAGSDFTLQDMKDIDFEDQDSAVYHFILNEKAAAMLGYSPEQAINKPLYMDARHGTIKAVVKNFHYKSLHNPIGPLVLFPGNWARRLLVRTDGAHVAQTISALQTKWKTIAPHRPFEYRFLDEDYQKMYDSEMRLGHVLKIFSGLAILLACLGLIGLSTYSAQQRVKEIGIRKVMGASVFNLVRLLSKDFVVLSFVAILIAFPIAWWATYQWLQEFAYRITISWWVFGFAALIAIVITVLSVSFQAIKSALINPVKSLRSE